MATAQILALLAKQAKVLGPLAGKALAKNAPTVLATVQRTPQGQRLMEKVGDRQRHGKQKIQAQIDLARSAATEELREQTLPERQDQCRSWMRALKVQELALQGADNQERRVAKARRVQVAHDADMILMEIIDTIGKWSETA